MTDAAEDRWLFGDRWYAVTLASDVLTRDGMGLELDDVGVAPGKGRIVEAFYDETTGQMTFTSFVSHSLPFELVEQFIAEARRRLPPAST